MLADFNFKGYIATNIVKDSTKSVQPRVSLSPSLRGGAQPRVEPYMEGVLLKDASSLSLLLVKLSGLARRKRAVSCTGTVERRGSPAVA